MITTKIHKLSLLEFATSCTRPFHCRCILATEMKGINVARTPGVHALHKAACQRFRQEKSKTLWLHSRELQELRPWVMHLSFCQESVFCAFSSLETIGHELQNISLFLPNFLLIHDGFWKGQSWTILIKLPLSTCWLSFGWSFLCIQSPIMTNIQI